MKECYSLENEKILLFVKAAPGSSKSQFGKIQEGRLKIKIAAAPEDGRANEELCSFLAKKLGCPKKDVILAAGERSRFKTVMLPPWVQEKLDKLAGASE